MPNLVKQRYIVSDNRQARVINSNDKLEEIYRDMNMKREDLQSPPEFEEGLFAERIEVSEEYTDWQQECEPVESVTQEDISKIIEDAKAEAEEIIRQATEQAEQIKENAYHDGYSEGQQKAEYALQEKELLLQREYAEQTALMQQEYDSALMQMEPQLVEAFTSIIKEVLAVDITEYTGIISELVIRTIKQLDAPKKLIVYCNAGNYTAIKEREAVILDYLGQGTEVEYVRDDKLLDSQCRIETERGIYDCGFDVQLNNLLAKMKLLGNRS